MTSTCYESSNMEQITVSEHTELTELVRGSEGQLLAWLMPLVRRESVALDMVHVERIDAAGIAALIALYRAAAATGHTFCIAHASPRVRELLSLVGLEPILISQNAVLSSHADLHFDRSAA